MVYDTVHELRVAWHLEDFPEQDLDYLAGARGRATPRRPGLRSDDEGRPRQGRQRLYSLNAQALKPIHDWVSDYERMWSERFEQLDVVLEELKEKE